MFEDPVIDSTQENIFDELELEKLKFMEQESSFYPLISQNPLKIFLDYQRSEIARTQYLVLKKQSIPLSLKFLNLYEKSI